LGNNNIKYETAKMGSICHLITDGKHGDCQSEDGSGYYFISSKDVNDRKINYENARQITFDDFQDTHRRTQLEPLDILITNSGTIGRMAIVKDDKLTPRTTFQKSVAILKPNKEKVLTYWLFYYLQSNKERLISYAGGTAQKNLLLRDLRAFEIELPALKLQNKVAAILSAYDDLIENNTRRIKILEEMARLIYREWFVEFKAPGITLQKATPEEKKVTGKDVFPEGWEVKKVGDILEFHIGGGWGNEKQSSGYPEPGFVIRGTDIPRAKYGQTDLVPFRFHKKSNLNSRILKTGDIIFEVSGGSKDQPLGRSLLVSDILLSNLCQNVICASFCKLLRVNQNVTLSEIFYLHLAEIYENETIYKYQVQSTGISNFKFEYFLKSEQLVIPNKESLLTFKELVSPIFRQVQLLGAKNHNLRQTRDLLLPKLISGEVEV
jgi:type I restriction enzyme S subunit